MADIEKGNSDFDNSKKDKDKGDSPKSDVGDKEQKIPGQPDDDQEKAKDSNEKQKEVDEGDIFRTFFNYVSSPDQNRETLQYALDLLKEQYSKKITKEQFKNLKTLAENRLSQLGKEKIDSKKPSHEEIKPKDTSKKESREGKEKIRETSGPEKSIPHVEKFQKLRKDIFSEGMKILDQARLYGEKDEEMPEKLREEAILATKMMVADLMRRPEEGKDFFMPPGLAAELEKQRPSFSKENQKNFESWWRNKLHVINEEYINERSDTNFTLLWELRQALNSLWPKDNDSKEEVKRVNELRGTLTKEFEAHMGFHNFIYLYRRVSGVGDIVAATHLFNMRDVEVLMEKPEVIKYLKIFANKGKEFEELEKAKFKLDWREGSADRTDELDEDTDKITKRSRVGEIEDEEKEIKKFLKNLQNGLRDSKKGKKEKVEDAWAAIMAGGLFSALHGAAKYKLILNTGDFFFGRLYNVPGYAKELWESKWGRNPLPGLYDALGLGLTNFWEKNIEPNLDNLLNKKFDDKDDGEITTKAVSGLDADDIRKLILKPGQLIDEPTDGKLKFMLEKFNHLKGAKRSEWFKDVFEQMALYYQGQVLPGVDSLPSFLRKSNSKKDFPNILPWSKETTKWKIIGLGQILAKEDREDLLREFVGNKFQRGSTEFAKTSMPVILNTIWGGIKGFFGSFFKYLFGDIK